MRYIEEKEPSDRTEATIRLELGAAQVEIVPFSRRARAPYDIPASIEGRLAVNGYVFRFERRRSTWLVEVVDIPRPRGAPRRPCRLPAVLARKLNSHPFMGEKGFESGTPDTLGSVVRAGGASGGLDSKQLTEDGEKFWYVDSQGALVTLVRWFHSHIPTL